MWLFSLEIITHTKYNPDGSQPLIQQAGTSSVTGSILLPASQISAYNGVQVFPGVNVSGNWQNVKEDGSGSAPVSTPIIPVPRTYNFNYVPFSGNNIKQ